MDNLENLRIKDKYNKMARSYDAVIDRLIPGAWRRRAAGFAYGSVLEVGIGTGSNLSYYSTECQEILGVDLSCEMLRRAIEKKSLCKVPVHLKMMDVQKMSLESEIFDSVLASFVFCNVPDPEQALLECCRVLKPGGRLILLEHMSSDKMMLKRLMNWLDPLTMKLLGDHINRNTLSLVVATGFNTHVVENLFGDIVRLIVAER